MEIGISVLIVAWLLTTGAVLAFIRKLPVAYTVIVTVPRTTANSEQ